MPFTEPAFAKLNLSLDITGRRADGYHLLSMVNLCVSLQDTLQFSPCSGALQVDCRQVGALAKSGFAAVAGGPENLVFQAAKLFADYTGIRCEGLRITVEKRIPSQAGLGGGSADAAAALRGLCRWHKVFPPQEALLQMAAALGADVPFCLLGGAAQVQGIGEQLRPLAPLPVCWFVLAKPAVGVETAAAFRAVDCEQNPLTAHTPSVLEAWESGEWKSVARVLGNAFAQTALPPESAFLQKRLLQLGAWGTSLSGSGSAVFGVFSQESAARRACAALSQEAPWACCCSPVWRKLLQSGQK